MWRNLIRQKSFPHRLISTGQIKKQSARVQTGQYSLERHMSNRYEVSDYFIRINENKLHILHDCPLLTATGESLWQIIISSYIKNDVHFKWEAISVQETKIVYTRDKKNNKKLMIIIIIQFYKKSRELWRNNNFQTRSSFNLYHKTSSAITCCGV